MNKSFIVTYSISFFITYDYNDFLFLLTTRIPTLISANEAYKKKKLGFPVPLREWMREDDLYQKVYDGLQTPIIKQLFDDQKL